MRFTLLFIISDYIGLEHGLYVQRYRLVTTIQIQSCSSYPPQFPLTNHSIFSLLPTIVISTCLSTVNLPVAGTACKWNHTLFVSLCLPGVTKHDIFSVSFYVVAYFKVQFPFTTERQSTLGIYQTVFIHSSLDGLWKSLQLLAVVKHVAMTSVC